MKNVSWSSTEMTTLMDALSYLNPASGMELAMKANKVINDEILKNIEN